MDLKEVDIEESSSSVAAVEAKRVSR